MWMRMTTAYVTPLSCTKHVHFLHLSNSKKCLKNFEKKKLFYIFCFLHSIRGCCTNIAMWSQRSGMNHIHTDEEGECICWRAIHLSVCMYSIMLAWVRTMATCSDIHYTQCSFIKQSCHFKTMAPWPIIWRLMSNRWLQTRSWPNGMQYLKVKHESSHILLR